MNLPKLSPHTFAFFLLAHPLFPGEADFQFPEGEKLEYSMKWAGIKVGNATLERMQDTELDGTPCLHFNMTAKTYGVADKIYKVRDNIHSYTDLGLRNTLLYTKRQQEGKTDRDIRVTFDRQKQLATHHDFGQADPPLEIREGLLDPLSVMYSLRNQEFKVGEPIHLPATDGKKVINIKVGVDGEEEIEVPAGTFQAYRIVPGTGELKGVFEKSKDSKIEIWMSKEKPHYPLKMKSKVIVGSFTGKLEKIRKPGE